MKTGGSILKKNVLGKIRGEQLFYINLRFDYKIATVFSS